MTDHGDVQQTDGRNSYGDDPKGPWYKDGSNLIALLALVVSLGSVGVSVYQARVAKEQNIVAEQQELVTFVGYIAQDPATIAQESQTISNESALSTAQGGVTTAELVDSEEAATLINLLGAEYVTSTEYYETAVGLQAGQSYDQALSFLERAAALPSDPRTHASALRFEAQIYYQLGQVSEAEKADALAEQAYSRAPDVTLASQRSNVAFTELFDAFYQASISCATSQAEVGDAQDIFKANPGLENGMVVEYNNAENQLRHHC